jgi:hypothetical protein
MKDSCTVPARPKTSSLTHDQTVATKQMTMELISKDKAFVGAVDALFSQCDGIWELNAELRNTLANVYFRFFLLALKRGDMSAFYSESVMPGDIIDDVESAPLAVKVVRRALEINDPGLAEYLANTALDRFKYNIQNIATKMQIRRLIERKFITPRLEIDGLYDGMCEFYIARHERESDAR